MSLKQFNRKFEPAEPLPIVAVVGAAALGYCLYKSCSTPAIQKERERQIQQLIRESDNVRWANMIVNKENLVEQSVTYFADRLSQKMISAHAVERLFDDTDVLQYVILKLRINWIDLCLDVGFQEKYPHCLDNYDVTLLSCETNSSMYKWLSDTSRSDDKIIRAALNCYGYREEKGYYRAGHNFDILRDIPQQLNAEYALLAVKMNGSALKHVTSKTNLITMEALMENGYQAFQYATEEQKNTRLIRATAFEKSNSLINSPDFLKYCSPAEIVKYKRDKKRAVTQLEDNVMNGY
tara:strand:+ start:782 stop:1663 length:882 start_codon:yes stop_codon:yes gene_type:complete